MRIHPAVLVCAALLWIGPAAEGADHLALQEEHLEFGAVTQNRVCGPPDTLCLSAPLSEGGAGPYCR